MFLWLNIQIRVLQVLPSGAFGMGVDWMGSLHVTDATHYRHISSARWTCGHVILDRVSPWLGWQLQGVICSPPKTATVLLLWSSKFLTSPNPRTHGVSCNMTSVRHEQPSFVGPVVHLTFYPKFIIPFTWFKIFIFCISFTLCNCTSPGVSDFQSFQLCWLFFLSPHPTHLPDSLTHWKMWLLLGCLNDPRWLQCLGKHFATSTHSDNYQLSIITEVAMHTKLPSDKFILLLQLIQITPFSWLYIQFLNEHKGPYIIPWLMWSASITAEFGGWKQNSLIILAQCFFFYSHFVKAVQLSLMFPSLFGYAHERKWLESSSQSLKTR